MKRFHLSDILTVVTGRFLSESMDNIFDILNYLTNDDLMTQQLPSALEICKPQLLEQLPFLRNIKVPKKNFHKWIKKQTKKYGEYLTIEPIKNWAKKHPVQELLDMGIPESKILFWEKEG